MSDIDVNTDIILRYRGYYSVLKYSETDKCLYGKIEGIRSLILFDDEELGIEDAFHEAVDEYLADCQYLGKEPERPCDYTKLEKDALQRLELLRQREQAARAEYRKLREQEENLRLEVIKSEKKVKEIRREIEAGINKLRSGNSQSVAAKK